MLPFEGDLLKICAIDPGTVKSGFVIYETETSLLCRHGHVSNDELSRALNLATDIDAIVVERFESFGRNFGESCILTIFAIGQFDAFWRGPRYYIKRSEIKRWLTGNKRHTDRHVKAALLDRWGGVDKAVGSKKSGHCGPLYGLKTSHCWAALAVAVYFQDEIEPHRKTPPKNAPRWRDRFEL